MQPLRGILVVDFSRYLPGPFATRELLRLGGRVVRVEPLEGDPMRHTAPAWDAAINAGKESVAIDLKAEPELGRALCERADVVVESWRPGVASRLGVGSADVPASAVYCSITGFGTDNRHELRAGHDVNYLGWAGALHDTAPALPPVPVADLAAGALSAALEILAGLLERERTGTGPRLTISMTHNSHRLASFRLGGEPVPRLLTGGLASYGLYGTADGRHVTLGALEPKFFARLTELLGRPELAERQYDSDGQDELRDELTNVFSRRPLAEWLELFDSEDVCVGPVATLEEAASDLAPVDGATAAPLGAHTVAWRRELALA